MWTENEQSPGMWRGRGGGEEPADALQWTIKNSAIEDPDFALGIIRLSTTQQVVFINRAARAMVGNAIRIGMNITDLALDPASRDSLRDAMNKRFAGERGSSYRMNIDRKDTRTRVRMSVSAIPEYDSAGRLTGSIGFFVDESIDEVAKAIHKVIAEADRCTALLCGITRHLPRSHQLRFADDHRISE